MLPITYKTWTLLSNFNQLLLTAAEVIRFDHTLAHMMLNVEDGKSAALCADYNILICHQSLHSLLSSEPQEEFTTKSQDPSSVFKDVVIQRDSRTDDIFSINWADTTESLQETHWWN